jgi:hypothetical protein
MVSKVSKGVRQFYMFPYARAGIYHVLNLDGIPPKIHARSPKLKKMLASCKENFPSRDI